MLGQIIIRALLVSAGCSILLGTATVSHAAFDLTFTYVDPEVFDAESLELIQESVERSELLLESIILGYRHEPEADATFEIQFESVFNGVAAGGSQGSVMRGEYTMPEYGQAGVNPDWVVKAANGFDLPDLQGVNFLDALINHEVIHALGFGGRWETNGAYVIGSGKYTGAAGLAAYQSAYEPGATYVPVELAGGGGTRNSHWDQLLRSSTEEGDPLNPWVLSPLTGIVDQRGRDLGQTLLSGAIDPDYGIPYLSNLTVQSLRDIGYEVISSFPLPGDLNEDGPPNTGDLDHLATQIRAETDDLFYDLNSDGSVTNADFETLMDILGTQPGDANFDLRFDSSDLVTVFEAAEYEDDASQNSQWITGDWNGDAEFDTSDLIYAFAWGGYEAPAASAVPEPSTIKLCLVLLPSLAFFHRRR